MIDQALAQQTARIGSEIGLSDWITVNQARIDAFADVTEDHQFIHVDPDRAAKETPFGGTIAHGFLTLSLASKIAVDSFGMLPGQTMGVNYGFEKIRFLNPVRAGDAIRGRFILNAVRRKSDAALLQEFGLTMEIKGQEKPALTAAWLGLAVFGG